MFKKPMASYMKVNYTKQDEIENMITQRLPSWQAVIEQQNSDEFRTTIYDLFQQDPNRAASFSVRCGEIFLDFSKSHLTQDLLSLFVDVASEAQLQKKIDALFTGQKVNNTERRAALHTLLRTSKKSSLYPLSNSVKNYQEQIFQCHKKMRHIADDIHQKRWLGHTGKPITHIINIGIGGSDLGPRMVCEALADYKIDSLSVLFVANVDAAEFITKTQNLKSETTLFIVASKTFTTLETITNANLARQWLLDNGCIPSKLKHHFIATTTNTEQAINFGIDPDNIMPMWDWVGGRYSLWSAIGLPIALAIGWDNFLELLSGAEEMDQHFATAEPSQNMPVIMAFITLWYSQIWQVNNQAVLPYSHNLRSFPMFLQQLDMESLGKSVNRNGEILDHHSGISLWGTEESNAQHSFHQLLIQGSYLIPIDFIAVIKPQHNNLEQHQLLLSSCLSQSQAMMQGKDPLTSKHEWLNKGATHEEAEQMAKHTAIAGNKSSNTILLQQLSPATLGALIALYEHKVFTLGALLDINPFDQWSVELGKQLGSQVNQSLTDGNQPDHWDSSTKQLAQMISNGKLK